MLFSQTCLTDMVPVSEAQGASVLVYQPRPFGRIMTLAGMETLLSPVSFLARAMEGNCRRLIVFFEWASPKEKAALLELCAVLRSNRNTIEIPLICVLPYRHRELLLHLQAANVEWAAFLAPESRSLWGLLAELNDARVSYRPLQAILQELCPHLNYAPAGAGKEMCVCGAYRDRMVLGRSRRDRFCENSGFALCQFLRDFEARQGRPSQA
jgi:hypothetical protein